MGLYCGFDLSNDFGFTEATEEYGIIPDYSEGCAVFVDTFLQVSTSMVPVDTGYLRSTLTASTDGNFWCEAETICEYAQYVEYGTWRQRAQPYFTPAIEAALDAAIPLWIAAEEEAWLEEEMLLEEEQEEEALMQQMSLGIGSMMGGSIAEQQFGRGSPMGIFGAAAGGYLDWSFNSFGTLGGSVIGMLGLGLIGFPLGIAFMGITEPLQILTTGHGYGQNGTNPSSRGIGEGGGGTFNVDYLIEIT